MSDTIFAFSLGLGLSAACGFRVFVPMFMLSLGAYYEWIPVSDGFSWLGTLPALMTFGVATVVEIGAYYVPWVDNALDTVATPAAALAGILVTAACIIEMEPLMQWTLAVIAGGGAAGTVKTGLTGFRLSSTAVTGGIANPLIATVEWLSALAISILSLVLPILAACLAIIIILGLSRFAIGLFRRFRMVDED